MESETKQKQEFIRTVYHAAEVKDGVKFASYFTEDGTFTDESAGVVYRGPKELAKAIEIYATAFPDMHRELYDIYVSGQVIVVELSLNGTFRAPLALPTVTVPPTGKKTKAPCCDVFKLKDGKVQAFDCYPCWPSQ